MLDGIHSGLTACTAMGLKIVTVFVLALCACIKLSSAGIALKSIEDCNPGTDYPVKIDGKLEMEGEKQFVSFDTKIPFALDDTMQLNLTIQALTGDKPTTVIADVEKDVCNTAHKYLGQFLFDIEKEMGLEPGKCPIPAGDYSLKHYGLSLEKVSVAKSLPVGNVQAVAEATKISDGSVILCKIIKVTNA